MIAPAALSSHALFHHETCLHYSALGIFFYNYNKPFIYLDNHFQTKMVVNINIIIVIILLLRSRARRALAPRAARGNHVWGRAGVWDRVLVRD